MIKITFPDGAVKEYESGASAMDIAKSISNSLAKKILAAEVDGQVWDLTRPITHDATLKLLTGDDAGGKSTMWHSSAHLMAEALESLYPGVKFGIGPPIDRGFYYDVDLGDRKLTEEDLVKIEDKMRELAAKNNEYKRRDVPKAEAIAYFTEKGDQYKLELLEGLNDGEITFYTQGNFTDLCRGPHIPNTSYIKAVKLYSIAGAYWRGNEKNKQLTRIYGITFQTPKELDAWLALEEEARKRDHRKIGRDLELFTFDDEVGPGLPLWMPRGAAIIEELERLAKHEERKNGYVRVRTPHIAKESIYIRSGHLPYYKESMFPPMEMDNVTYYLKPMNCPHHHKIYGTLPRTYKDLPLRLAEYSACYRYEGSGELFGLMRVRSLQMNDAHIYCTRDQFEQEFRRVNEMYLNYFKLFGIDKYVMRFSTHAPEKRGAKYVDMPELWERTENMVREVLTSSNIPFVEIPDEAAFYGPKIDVQVYSVIGREFTLATNQVDFLAAQRFDLRYITSDNKEDLPLVIHRAPLGTHERFIGFLIEHFAGNFPVWLAPDQVAVLPISDKHIEYATQLRDTLFDAGIRVVLDERSEKIGKKIRDAEMMKIPYMLIVGDKEAEAKAVGVRKHGEGDKGEMPFVDFLAQVKDEATAHIR